ncbi:MAG: secretin N-terminal domain-containing protein, partial [Pirellula sp.]
MDTAANLADISRILSEEQSDVVLNNLAREFPLEHVRASEVREQLVAFLKLDDGKGPKSAPNSGGNPELEAQQQQMLMLQQAQMAGQQPNAGGAPRPAATQADIRLVANNRRNSLIVNAPPDKMAIVAAFISRVDVTSPNEQYQALSTRMKVYRLASLEPKKFVGSLLALNVLEPTTRLEVDDKNKSMIAYASLADHLTIQETLKKLDGSARQVEVIQLRRLRAEEVAGTIRLLMGLDQEKKEESPRRGFYAFDFAPQPSKESTSKDQLRVGANVGNNQLILWANEFEAAEIKKLLTKLGEISPQGGSDQRIRVIEGNRSQQMREYLERLQQTWDAKGIELDIPSDSEFEVDFPSTDSAAPNTEKTDRKIKDGQKKAPKPFDDAPPLGAASAPENDMNGILVAVDQPPEGELTQENEKRNAGSLRSFPQ